MEHLLTTAYFRYLLFPLASIVLGIWIKFVTRNDQYAKFKKEDIAVGLDLYRTALLMYVVLLSDRALELKRLASQIQPNVIAKPDLQTQMQTISVQLTNGSWVLLVFMLGLWGTSTVVRRWGWHSESELKPTCGIAIPLVMGVLSLLAVLIGAGQ
jgi:hypothetical protein